VITGPPPLPLPPLHAASIKAMARTEVWVRVVRIDMALFPLLLKRRR
jgi:hypothetical protein